MHVSLLEPVGRNSAAYCTALRKEGDIEQACRAVLRRADDEFKFPTRLEPSIPTASLSPRVSHPFRTIPCGLVADGQGIPRQIFDSLAQFSCMR